MKPSCIPPLADCACCGLALQGLAALRRRYGFLLAVDEAHATLVCGASGGGAAEMMCVAADIDVHIGTLSKAIGAQAGTRCAQYFRVMCSTLPASQQGGAAVGAWTEQPPFAWCAATAVHTSRAACMHMPVGWRLQRHTATPGSYRPWTPYRRKLGTPLMRGWASCDALGALQHSTLALLRASYSAACATAAVRLLLLLALMTQR